MASVNDYLKKLLYQYDCVVVPELGAFLTHYQPASFTESSGIYLPPRKRVAFNEALRLDDGILANYIMLHEPVTREGAQRHVGLFVGELRQQVEQTGRFELDGIGTFSQNEEGRLQFDPSLRHNFFGEAFGMSAISVQLVDQPAVDQPVLEAIPITALGPVLVRDEDTTIEPIQPSYSYWRVAATALLIGSLGLISYFSVLKPGQSLQSSLNPANLFRLPALNAEHSTVIAKTKKQDAAPKTAVTPAVVPVAEPIAEPIPVKPIATPVETNHSPVALSKQPQVQVTDKEVVKAVQTGPYYTVIAGSFSSKVNALRLRRQLKKAGYTDAYVICPTQKGQLYKVAAVGSSVRDEAVASMSIIEKVAHSEPWLYTK